MGEEIMTKCKKCAELNKENIKLHELLARSIQLHDEMIKTMDAQQEELRKLKFNMGYNEL